jgi:hypothetical protein
LHTHIWVCMKSMIYVCNLYSQITLQKFRLIGVWGLSDFGCLGLRNLGWLVFGTDMTFGIERALSWLMFGYGCRLAVFGIEKALVAWMTPTLVERKEWWGWLVAVYTIAVGWDYEFLSQHYESSLAIMVVLHG